MSTTGNNQKGKKPYNAFEDFFECSGILLFLLIYYRD